MGREGAFWLVALRETKAAAPMSTDGGNLKHLLPGVPLVESPFFDEILPSCGFDEETRRIATDLNRYGFAVLRFDDNEIEERAERIKRDLGRSLDFDDWRATKWPLGRDLRFMDSWKSNADTRAVACNISMIKLLSDVFGRRAWPFQTLIFPVGSQQHYHSDSVHFSSIPERFMCAVWVALEDVHEDAGPLVYYPGSHKWPILYNELLGIRVTGTDQGRDQSAFESVWEALVTTHGLEPKQFCPRKGDALIWLANLLHGGARQKDPHRTRWSQVTHYYFENCTYITPMASDVMIGRSFVRQMIDILTGDRVSNVYVDVPLDDIERLANRDQVPAGFNGERYLELNPDVAVSGLSPHEHYLAHGRREGRHFR
jgi:Phytanoyl-CoA dioxygenase (PhyH)